MSEAGRAPTERNTTTIGGSRSLEALRGTRTLNERSKGLGHYSWAPVAPCTYNGSAATTGAQGRERAGSDRVSGAGAKDGSDRGMVKDKGEGGGQQRRKCVLATRWAWGRTVRRRICVSRSIRRSVSLSLSLSSHVRPGRQSDTGWAFSSLPRPQGRRSTLRHPRTGMGVGGGQISKAERASRARQRHTHEDLASFCGAP